ncbi:MAG: imidazoleglycerol-phosphate dehydratase HisB [Verrucomicrobiota bacterium]
MQRSAQFERNTSETQICGSLSLDGVGNARVDTGIGFFDHMLNAWAKHGMFDLELTVRGDLEVDCHHTLEDTGLVLGGALEEALGGKVGIRRFGASVLPMDDALVRVVTDLSGRPYVAYRVALDATEVGGVPLLLFREFFRAFANSANVTVHVDKLAGDEPHHVIEAAFKALGRALDQAKEPDPRVTGVPSTKGTLV